MDSIFRLIEIKREEFTNYWFFFNGDKMVYFEIVPNNIEKILPYEIQFSKPSGVLTVEREKAFFKVSKMKEIKKEYYVLSLPDNVQSH